MNKQGTGSKSSGALIHYGKCAYEVIMEQAGYNKKSKQEIDKKILSYRYKRLASENKGYKVIEVGLASKEKPRPVMYAIIQGPKGGKIVVDRWNLYKLFKQLPYEPTWRNIDVSFNKNVEQSSIRAKYVGENFDNIDVRELAKKHNAKSLILDGNTEDLERLNKARVIDRIVYNYHKYMHCENGVINGYWN